MKNWKTTLIGFIIAVLIAIEPIVQNGNFDIKRDWLQLLGAIASAFYGFNSKDNNVTGIGDDARHASDLK